MVVATGGVVTAVDAKCVANAGLLPVEGDDILAVVADDVATAAGNVVVLVVEEGTSVCAFKAKFAMACDRTLSTSLALTDGCCSSTVDVCTPRFTADMSEDIATL